MDDQFNRNYLLGDHRIDMEKRILSRNGEPIHLPRRPFDVLHYLIENHERLVSRTELLEQFWGGKDVYEDALSKAVGAIRKALGDHNGNTRFIETRWAGGYRYIGPLEEQLQNGNGTSAAQDKHFDQNGVAHDVRMAPEQAV